MKIAIAYENGMVFQHFGETPAFLLAEVEGETILSQQIHENGGVSHVGLVSLLKELGVNALLCGGIGGGAYSFLKEAGIEVYASLSGSCQDVLDSFLKGELIPSDGPTHQCSCHH